MAIKKPKKPVAKTVQADEIRLLEDRAHVRLRPGMYIPNKDYCVYELVDNSVDEFVNGFGSMVELSINEEPIDMTVNFHFKCMKCGYIEKIKTTTGLASFLRSIH